MEYRFILRVKSAPDILIDMLVPEDIIVWTYPIIVAVMSPDGLPVGTLCNRRAETLIFALRAVDFQISVLKIHPSHRFHIAFFGQTFAHSKQSMHSVPFSRERFGSRILTFIGQTRSHLPQFMHFVSSTLMRVSEK